jgi:hypothetical protein
MRYDGGVWTHIAMRHKGNSSLASGWRTGVLKLSFRFEMESFEKKTNKEAADYSDVMAAISARREAMQAWRSGLDAVFNVQSFLDVVAFSRAVSHWDGCGVMAPEPTRHPQRLAARLWPRLTKLPAASTPIACLNAALVLLSDTSSRPRGERSHLRHARVAGRIAHALEEYGARPLRFSRAPRVHWRTRQASAEAALKERKISARPLCDEPNEKPAETAEYSERVGPNIREPDPLRRPSGPQIEGPAIAVVDSWGSSTQRWGICQ